jgi:hypothetical protein
MSFIGHRKAFWELPLLMTGLPLAGKFPCKRKFWPVQSSWEICCRCAEKLLAHAIFYKNSKI